MGGGGKGDKRGACAWIGAGIDRWMDGLIGLGGGWRQSTCSSAQCTELLVCRTDYLNRTPDRMYADYDKYLFKHLESERNHPRTAKLTSQ